MIYFVHYIFYGIPIVAILFFIISLYRYCQARKKNKQEPGCFSEKEMKKRKLMLISSLVIAGILAFIVIAFIILIFSAVAFM